jgi:NAD(P)-dependent dehydrogenase (short-subunit alcohol dehydrogenase family)
MGLATAKLLGKDHHVVISDVRQERLDTAMDELGALGISGEAAVCDVTDRAAVDRLAAQARDAGSIRSLVHTAGLSPSMAGPERIIAVNALGTVNVSEAFLPLASEGFSLVNVASAAGHQTAGFPVPKRAYGLALTNPEQFVARLVKRCGVLPRRMQPGIAYSISKHFVIWWTEERAKAFGEKGARIVSVSPGSFDTEMGRLEESIGAGALAAHSALQRYGTVEEIAEVLAFCAGPGPGYLTGTDIKVDGGRGEPMSAMDKLKALKNL